MTNIKEGLDNNDAITKHQLQVATDKLIGAQPGVLVSNKSVIYSSTKSIHAEAFYIQESGENPARILTKTQTGHSIPATHLSIPDLMGIDSEIVLTSTDQSIDGNKTFINNIISNKSPSSNSYLTRKDYVGNNGLNKKTGGLRKIRLNSNVHFTITDKFKIWVHRFTILLQQEEVDAQDRQRLSTNGGSLNGNLRMFKNKIINLSNPRTGSSDAMSYSHFQSRFFFEEENNDINCNGKRLKNIGSSNNRDQLINRAYIEDNQFGIISGKLILKRDIFCRKKKLTLRQIQIEIN